MLICFQVAVTQFHKGFQATHRVSYLFLCRHPSRGLVHVC